MYKSQGSHWRIPSGEIIEEKAAISENSGESIRIKYKGDKPLQNQSANKITKKTSDVPRSGCFIMSATGIRVSMPDKAKRLFEVGGNLVYAKNRESANIKANLAISDGVRLIGPKENHRIAPMRDIPTNKTRINNPIDTV